jgi:hypothetical protein
VFLIDLVSDPVDKLDRHARAKALRHHVAGCVDEVRTIAPTGIIVCHKPTFLAVSGPLRDAGLPLLHDEPIPFPLAHLRAPFVAGMRVSIRKLNEREGIA